MKKLLAEFVGTAWLVIGGCGSAILAGAFPEYGIGFLGVSLAFGLTVMTMVYAIGNVSGCHLNPAVSIGLWVGGRFDKKDVLPYIGAQVLGAIMGATIIYFIASGKPGYELGEFAANGYEDHSPGHYSIASAFLCETVMTFMFLIVILGSTHKNVPKGFAGIAIGLALTLIHLISIPVTKTSVNPARSTCQALFVSDWAVGQLWLFWLAPILGAALAGMVYKYLQDDSD